MGGWGGEWGLCSLGREGILELMQPQDEMSVDQSSICPLLVLSWFNECPDLVLV